MHEFPRDPSAGKVCISGVTIDCGGLGGSPPKDIQGSAHELRQQVGMVFQGFNLFPHRTILDNVTLPRRSRAGSPARRPRPTGTGFYGLAMDKGNTALAAEINAALAKMIQNGELRDILSRWGLWTGMVANTFGQPEEPSLPDTEFRRFLVNNKGE